MNVSDEGIPMVKNLAGILFIFGMSLIAPAMADDDGEDEREFEAALESKAEEKYKSEAPSLNAAGGCGEGGWARHLMGPNSTSLIYKPVHLDNPDQNTEITMTVCLNTTLQGGMEGIRLLPSNVTQGLSIGSCYMFTTFTRVAVTTGRATGTGAARAEICYRLDNIEYKPVTEE
jgi:hypothetical protein